MKDLTLPHVFHPTATSFVSFVSAKGAHHPAHPLDTLAADRRHTGAAERTERLVRNTLHLRQGKRAHTVGCCIDVNNLSTGYEPKSLQQRLNTLVRISVRERREVH